MQTLLYTLRCALLWLVRFRHRRGYGIHSPFAFRFVTGVVYERGCYYAYAPLKRLFRASKAKRKWRWCHYQLLFRLTNFQQPKRVCLVDIECNALAAAFVRAACPKVDIGDKLAPANMLITGEEWPQQAGELMNALLPGGLLVVTKVTGCNKAAWQRLTAHPKAQVTFDLAHFGLVMYRPDLQQQHYIISY